MMLKLHSPIPSTNTRRPNEITKSSGIEEIDVLFNGGWPSARLSHVISDRIDLMIHIVLSSAFSYVSKGQNVIILTSTNDINQQVISKGLENIPAAKEIDEIALNRLNLAHVFDPWAVLTFLDSLVVQSTSTSGQTDLLLIVGLDQLLGPLQDKRERGGSSSGNVSTAVSCEPLLASLLLRLRRVAGFGTSVIVCSGLTQQQVNAPATASTFYESFDIALSIKPGLQPGFASADVKRRPPFFADKLSRCDFKITCAGT